jgi:uncharacterized protein YjbI with pentapeptide repeats
MPRLTYEQSLERLRERGFLGAGEQPPLPSRMPQPTDEVPLGLSFFRTAVEDEDLPELSIPRTLFCRSLVSHTNFRGSDLAESFMCWNDFVRVDFSWANLSWADLRAAMFDQVSFAGADLSGADLRRSDFTQCDFTDAKMAGARLAVAVGRGLELSIAQRGSIAWQDDEGPEPAGG